MTSDNYDIDVLAFAPHPDDAELFCGGLLIKMAEMGRRTAVVDLTHGELSSRGNLEIRSRETENATAILKLAHRENLSFPDGGIGPFGAESAGASEKKKLDKAVAAIRINRPEIVLIPYWQSRHPDHAAASEICSKACFFAGLPKYRSKSGKPPHSPRQVIYYQTRTEFRPSFVVDISDVAEQKSEAIRCYQSQVNRDFKPTQGQPETLVSSPLSLSSIDARDQYYGAMIGVKHGEPFLLKSALGISDPLEHFRANPTNGGLIFPGER